ncbi:MAG: DNA repair exonuclease [Nannocystaceae bacterium]|nr:DNA repair exonuclease [Nannocystaceae bacterium]
MRDGDDVALKLLHTADWHLGKRYPQFGENDELELMRARMAVIDNVFGEAWSNQVDAVLAAGDLFDTPDPGESWWRPLLDKIKARDWSERPLFLLPGNHDFLSNLSVWHPSHEFRSSLPEGVHVIDDDNFEAPLGKDGVGVLLSRPCRSRSDGMDNALALPSREPGDERIRVGMVHGSTFEMDGFQSNFPIAKDAAERRGLDYLAIGDTHAFKVYPPESSPTVYPSAPEPTNFGERNAGYVAVVFFARRNRRARIRQTRVARWTWEERTITDMASLRRLTQEDLNRTVLKLTLKMRVAAGDYDDAMRLVESLRGTQSTFGKVGVLRVDLSELVMDTTDLSEELAGLPEVLQRTAERLRELEDGPQSAVATRALGHLVRLLREAR